MKKNYPDPSKSRINVASSTDFTGIVQNITDDAVEGDINDIDDLLNKK